MKITCTDYSASFILFKSLLWCYVCPLPWRCEYIQEDKVLGSQRQELSLDESQIANCERPTNTVWYRLRICLLFSGKLIINQPHESRSQSRSVYTAFHISVWKHVCYLLEVLSSLHCIWKTTPWIFSADFPFFVCAGSFIWKMFTDAAICQTWG